VGRTYVRRIAQTARKRLDCRLVIFTIVRCEKTMRLKSMDQMIRLDQVNCQEAWWVWVTYGGTLACLFLAGASNSLIAALAVAMCLDARRIGRCYALCEHPSSVTGIHVRQLRIMGFSLHSGRYLTVVGSARVTRFGLNDV